MYVLPLKNLLLLKIIVSHIQVPMHVLHALGAFSSHSPEIISPALVRQVLTDSQKLCTQQSNDRYFQ